MSQLHDLSDVLLGFWQGSLVVLLGLSYGSVYVFFEHVGYCPLSVRIVGLRNVLKILYGSSQGCFTEILHEKNTQTFTNTNRQAHTQKHTRQLLLSTENMKSWIYRSVICSPVLLVGSVLNKKWAQRVKYIPQGRRPYRSGPA